MDENEQAAEQAAQAEVKQEEVRAQIIQEFGFDEVDDAERIDKAVAREVEHRKSLSAAIGQKIKYRSELEEARKTPAKPAEGTPAAPNPDDVSKLVEEKVSKTLEQRDLEALDLPEDIKKNIQRIAHAQGISVKQAARDPWIVSQIETHEKESQASEAAITRKNRSGGSKGYSVDTPPDVDMATEDGRKEWDSYLTWLKKQ